MIVDVIFQVDLPIISQVKELSPFDEGKNKYF